MMDVLKGILFDRLRQQGISESVDAAQVTAAFREEVAKRFGPSIAGGLRKVALKGDTLEVLATSGALASELRMAEFELGDALRARFKGRSFRLRIFA